MSRHPETDRLARLVDEAPAPDEAAHLADCASCREELDALRRQSEALRALPDIEPSPGEWAALAARLEAEGLMEDAAPDRRLGRRSAPGAGWRAAAAVALLLVGAAAGAWIGGSFGPAGQALAPAEFDEYGAGEGALAASSEEAVRAVQLAEAAYLAALARYLEVAEPDVLPDPIARLATLESIIVTTRAALHEAPADPVINGYHLTAVAQRDATLAQLAALVDEPWF